MKGKGLGTRIKEKLEGIESTPLPATPEWYLKKLRSVDAKKEPYSFEQIKAGFDNNSIALCEGFTVDKSNEELINGLCYYFAKDKRFGSIKINGLNKLSINKGLMLIGNYGFGKSILFDIFKSLYLPVTGFRIASTNEISAKYQQHGTEALREYMQNHWYYDDFGTEEKVSHYEQSKYIMRTVLEERYRQFQTFKYMTHASTNLLPEDIKARYGDRLYSRIFEMFNIILVNGDDRRMI